MLFQKGGPLSAVPMILAGGASWPTVPHRFRAESVEDLATADFENEKGRGLEQIQRREQKIEQLKGEL